MNTTRFSVVTISFNQATWLPEAIESVLRQAGPGIDVEYIVCDPGSKDNSREIIDSYGDRITRRVYERDDGPADGLNRGFAHATGDIYCYINSDDYFLDGAFAKVADWFARHPDVDVLCGHAVAVDAESRHIRKVWSEPYSAAAVAYGAHIQIQPSTFFRAAAFRACGGFDATNRINWDGDLLSSLYCNGSRIRIANEFLSAYRLHETSITMSGTGDDLRTERGAMRFHQLMGRDWRGSDDYMSGLLRLAKHLRWPGRTWERFVRGPMFRRGEWRPPFGLAAGGDNSA